MSRLKGRPPRCSLSFTCFRAVDLVAMATGFWSERSCGFGLGLDGPQGLKCLLEVEIGFPLTLVVGWGSNFVASHKLKLIPSSAHPGFFWVGLESLGQPSDFHCDEAHLFSCWAFVLLGPSWSSYSPPPTRHDP